MKESEALQSIENQINVTPQKVTIAKSYILQHFKENTSEMIREFLLSVEAKMPLEIVIHQSVDTVGMIKKAAEAISWTLSYCEAIWGLISANLLIPASDQSRNHLQHLPWTTVVPGQGGMSSGWDLQHLSVPIPTSVMLPRSRHSKENQPLSDPDLFLHNISIPNLQKDIEDSLREAVLCFRQELYLACLAMLGRASEGAWIELGLKLVKSVVTKEPKNANKVKDKLEDPFVGIGKKIMEILKLYERKDILGHIHEKSGVSIQDLRNAVIWSDQVRESRNSIHYGVKPSMPNSYEKVAAILIGAVPHIRLLYRVNETID